MSQTELPRISSALAAKGIKFEVRTPIACACAGGLPSLAGVWVIDDAQAELARAAVAEAEGRSGNLLPR